VWLAPKVMSPVNRLRTPTSTNGMSRIVNFGMGFLPSTLRVSTGLAQGQWLLPPNASQETFLCQLTNVPFGLSFHAQTCSV
jgi:hypothetical protein